MKRVLTISVSILCLTGAWAVPAASAARAHHHKGHHRKAHGRKALDQRKAAAKVARSFAHGSEGARRSALTRFIGKLGVPVVSGKGKLLTPKVHSLKHDFNVYDFEVAGAVDSLRAKRQFTANSLAAGLNAAKLRDGRKGFSAALIGELLRTRVRAALRKPRSAGSLLPLVYYNLAKSNKVDLRKASAPTLDGVSRLLLITTVAAPAQRKLALRGHHARARKSLATAADADESCLPGGTDRTATKLGALSEFGPFDFIGKTFKQVVKGPLTSLHAFALATLIDYQFTRNNNVRLTAYGPTGGAGLLDVAGRPLAFTIGVQMVADLPERTVRCGTAIGLKLPKKGPIPDVPVDWQGVAGNYRDLIQRGHVTREDKVTNSHGVATLTFTPNNEQLPVFGAYKVATGVLAPKVDFFTAFGNLLGAGVEAAEFNQVRSTQWQVFYHPPRKLILAYDHTSRFTYTQHDYQSGTDSTYDTKANRSWHIQANIPLEPSAGAQNVFIGEGNLKWLTAVDSRHVDGQTHVLGNPSGPACTNTEDDALTLAYGSRPAVPKSNFTLDKSGVHVESLDFDPGKVHEQFTSTYHTTSGPCGDGSGPQNRDQTTFLYNFQNVHFQDLVDKSVAQPVLHITDWTPGTGNVIATKTYVYKDPDGSQDPNSQYVDTFQIIATEGG